jgi:hypothetical protein
VLEYPSSHKLNIGNPAFLVNSTRYLVDDEFRYQDYESNRLEKPHRNLPVLGNRVRAYVAEPPPAALTAHWQRRIGTKPLRYAELGEPVPHVCLFPVQDLSPELHAVDPDVHYHVYSKLFINEIDCPQPIVYNELKCPSVLKVCRSSGGHGTWMINKEEDYDYWINEIRRTMPYAQTILTEMVTDVKHNMCCHLYLSRKGDVTWLACTEKIMDANGLWIGACLQVSRQDEWERLVRPATEPVSAALHARGFFGLYGVDVLVDGTSGRQYVIDINPRILGSTPLVFTALTFQKYGRSFEVAIFLRGVTVKAASPEAIIELAEAVADGELIVYSIVEKGDGVYGCQIGVFAASIAKCKAIAEAFC